ncbi:glycerophosphodiester phosphodiesterase [Polycladomyces sp. WAk]|uniref:Glycerophosphodiester phosphodiesterase n=1 Tax=Polycladomyces zharkentensis TaxID=2807616 RepID=A0ABS2WHA3_9BACL|nr:glycerophosphodiester phosphodiesterase [Polycladomyces sp. WAk]MBN2908927.1 glycerophosphodiester phosphodiesterase [Polycladomyces sp. WAk]
MFHFGKKLLIVTTLFVGLFISQATAALAASGGMPDENADKVITVAHRGASGYAPENTMAAFEKAVEMKADYIELDVQLSKDGHLVVIHDTTVDRTTDGTGKVGNLTLEELRKLDAGSYFGPEFAGERIPTLEEVLDAFRGKTGILIEMKAPHLYPGIEQKVADALAERNLDKPKNGKIIVQSFDFHSLKKFHNILPDVPIGVLTSGASHLTDHMLQEFKAYADYVNPHLSYVNKDLVNRIHALDMGIMAWTVRDQSQVAPLLEAGVDGIITDYPDYVPRHKD